MVENLSIHFNQEEARQAASNDRPETEEEYEKRMEVLWETIAQTSPDFQEFMDVLPTPPAPPPTPSAVDPIQAFFDEFLNDEPSTEEVQQLHQRGGGPTQPQEDLFKIETVREKRSMKFNTTATEYRVQVQLRPRVDVQDAVVATMGVLDQILYHVKEKITANNDQLRLIIEGSELDYPINIPFMQTSEMTTARLLRHVENVAQSKTNLFLNGDMNVIVYHVKNIKGSGRKRALEEGGSSKEEEELSKSSLERKRFEERKVQEPLQWFKFYIESKYHGIACQSIHECVAQYLFWRDHGNTSKNILQETVQNQYLPYFEWVKEHLTRCEEEESPTLFLVRWNEILNSEKKIRIVVLDYNNDDALYFLSPPNVECRTMVLYKMNDQFHLLLNPQKVRHRIRHHDFCTRCGHFYYNGGSRRVNVHVCHDLATEHPKKNNRSFRCFSLNPQDLVANKWSIVPEKGKTEKGERP